MKYEGIYQGGEWRGKSESIEKKERIIETIAALLDAYARMDKNLDELHFIVGAEGINADGDHINIQFERITKGDPDSDTHSVVIRDEDHYRDRERNDTIYRVDKVITDKDNNPRYDKLVSTIESLPQGDSVRDALNETLHDVYDIEDDTLYAYNDKFAETNMSVETAQSMLDGLVLTEIRQIPEEIRK